MSAATDEEAKAQVTGLLQSFGWADDEVVDLGDLTAARAPEMVLPFSPRLWQRQGTAAFNFRNVRDACYSGAPGLRQRIKGTGA